MDVRAFFRDYLLSKLLRKFHQVILVIFIGSILGGTPAWLPGIVGSLLFFLVYLSTYLYNDLLDYEEDKAGPVYTEKILALGRASPRDFLVLLGNISVIFAFLATLWDPLLGFFAVAAVVLNNLRTHMRGVIRRQVALMLVEFFNFEAFWQAFYGSPIPAIFTPLFIAYASMYAASHGVYKLRDRAKLSSVLRTREMRFLLIISLISILFALPALVLSIYHFVLLVVGALLYALPQYVLVSRVPLNSQESMVRIMNNHYVWITAVALLLLVGTLFYQYFGAPLRYTIPFADKLEPYYATAEYFDKLQQMIVGTVFGDRNGLKSKVV